MIAVTKSKTRSTTTVVTRSLTQPVPQGNPPAALGTPAGLMLAAAESTRSDSAEPRQGQYQDQHQGQHQGQHEDAAWPWAIERPHRPVRPTPSPRARAGARAGSAAGSAAGPRETVTASEASTSIQPMRLPHTRDTDPGSQRQTRQTTRTTNRTTATPLNPDAAAVESQPSSVTILSQQNVANRTTVIV